MSKKFQSTRLDSGIKIPAKAKITPEPVDEVEHIGTSVRLAAKMIDVSERHLWDLLKEERIRSVKSGTRTIVSVKSLREYVDGREASNNE